MAKAEAKLIFPEQVMREEGREDTVDISEHPNVYYMLCIKFLEISIMYHSGLSQIECCLPAFNF